MEGWVRWCRPLLAVEFTVLLVGILLSAGYGAAVGGLDAAGHRLGFNEPLSVGHLRLMAERWTWGGLGSGEGVCLVLLVAGFAALGLRVARVAGRSGPALGFARRKFLHGAIFLAAWAGVVLPGALGGAGWTGETIVEGDLSVVSWFGLWLAAWPLAYGCGWLANRWISATASGRG